MEVRSEEMLSSFLSFPSCVTLYRQPTSRIRPLAIYNVADTLWKPWISEGGHLLERTVIECYQSNLIPRAYTFVHPIGVGPSIAHPQPAVTGIPAFWVPLSPTLFISTYIYFCICLFLSFRVSVFFPLCLIPFHSNLLARLSPLFF